MKTIDKDSVQELLIEFCQEQQLPESYHIIALHYFVPLAREIANMSAQKTLSIKTKPLWIARVTAREENKKVPIFSESIRIRYKPRDQSLV